MKTTPYMSLLYGLIVFLSGLMSFQARRIFFPYFLETFLGLLFLLVFYFTLKENPIFYWIGCLFAGICIIYYGIQFYLTWDFFPAILTLFGSYLFILFILHINKVIGSEE